MSLPSRPLPFAALTVLVALLSCGGSVIPNNEDAGTGDGGSGGTGAAATGGAGGSVAGSGGGVAGTGGSVGGMGGGPAGAGGGPAGAGGAPAGAGGGPAGAGGTPACPPAPSCNWCGGAPRYDGVGCVVGYICANGADPCTTAPCSSDWDCPDGTCKDMLCWPGGVACSPQECMGSGGGGSSSCSCEWKCTDGNAYMFDCTTQGGGLSCSCYINGQSSSGCGTAGGSGGSPDACASCCGFPQ